MVRMSRPRVAALCVGIIAAFTGDAALAADTGNGSKNFRTPTTVPNFFSNEAGPMIGGAAETQRSPLYSNQTASSAAPAQPAAPSYAAAPQTRQHIAMAVPHGRALRGRGAPLAAHHVAVHGRAAYRVEAHNVGRAHSVHAVAASHTVSRPTHVTSSHRHARG
jgi:hypothetical protein